MSIINGIDYDNLAELAEHNRVPFHILCQRAEKGLPIEEVIDPNWVDYEEAARIIGCKYYTLAGRLSQGCDLEYWGITWKSKSKVKPTGKRGCGVLFKKTDLLLIRKIRLGAHLSLTSALKVYEAMKQGKF